MPIHRSPAALAVTLVPRLLVWRVARRTEDHSTQFAEVGSPQRDRGTIKRDDQASRDSVAIFGVVL